MNLIGKFFKRITDDLKQKDLIPLKILFFVHASTLFVLYPYLTIHMRELGINVEETAIMSAVTPVVSIVMPPLAGMLADKIGNFRLLLALSSAMGGGSALLLLLVPVGRITVLYPPDVELVTRCSSDDSLHMDLIQEFPCRPQHVFPYEVDLTIRSCGFICDVPDESEFDIAQTTAYAITIQSPSANETITYRYTVKMKENNRNMKDQTASRILKNDVNYKSTFRRVVNKTFYFPAPDMYDFFCDFDENGNSTCNVGEEEYLPDLDASIDDVHYFRGLLSHQIDATEVSEFKIENLLLRGGNNSRNDDLEYSSMETASCKDHFAEHPDAVKVSTFGVGSRSHLNGCRAGCLTTAPRGSLCSNNQQHLDIDPVFTFWCYLAVRVFIGIIGGTAFAMFEGAVIAILREQQADYGLQRIYGSIGGMISSPLSGLMIDYASRGKGYTDFRPAFYLYSGLKVMSGILMLTINLEFKQPAQNLLEDVKTVFRNVEIVALFIACFIMGTAWGYIESFLFWLLQDLGASRSLMGVTITVGGIAGLPLLVMSGPIIQKIGHANVLFIGFVFYAVRLLGYSLIYNPWYCLIFEALESVTTGLAFTAAVTYAAKLSSVTTDTSVQGLLGGLYYGVGKGSGSLIGGYLMKAFGTRPTYQIFSASTLITGCFYFLFNRFYLRKRQTEGNEICKKKPKTDLGTTGTYNKNKDFNVVSISLEAPGLQKTENGNVNHISDKIEAKEPKIGVDNSAFNNESEAPSSDYVTKQNGVVDKNQENKL